MSSDADAGPDSGSHGAGLHPLAATTWLPISAMATAARPLADLPPPALALSAVSAAGDDPGDAAVGAGEHEHGEGEGEGEETWLPRLRLTALPAALAAEFQALDRQIAWSDLSPRTTQIYRRVIANYWSCCAATGRDRWSIAAVWDYVYARAYPRMRALQRLGDGVPPAARGQPGIGRGSVGVVVSAISKAFVASGHLPLAAHPQWSYRLGGLLRRLRQVRDRKAPILREDLIAAVGRARSARAPLVQLRDAALLLLGWSCALRRSELVAVHREHIQEQPTGWILWVPQSKTDQHARGRAIPLYGASVPELDARLACLDWAVAAGIAHGPLFRPIDRYGRVGPAPLTTRSVATILQSYCQRDNVSGHSLRIGFVTQGGIDGKDNHALRVVTGHTNDAMLNEYRRVIDPAAQGPGSLL